MAKLGNFFAGNKLPITQGAHGFFQAFTAFDFDTEPLELIVPTGYKTWTVEGKFGSGQQSGFYLTSPDRRVSIIFVHAVAYKFGVVKPGQKLGKSSWNHFHISIKVDGKWRWIFDYLKRTIDLVWAYGGYSKWADWNTYKTNLHLPGTLRIAVTLVPLRQRVEPKTAEGVKIIQVLPKGTTVIIKKSVIGQSVGGDKVWHYINYKGKLGYISARYCNEKSN